MRELKPVAPDLIDFTPGRAVGFLFIPVFNFYWLHRVWFRLTKTIGRLRALSPQSAASSPESVFAGGCVIVLLTLGFVFNSLARLEPWSLLLGELFFVTTIVYTQVTLNRAWRTALVLPPVPAAPPLVMAT